MLTQVSFEGKSDSVPRSSSLGLQAKELPRKSEDHKGLNGGLETTSVPPPPHPATRPQLPAPAYSWPESWGEGQWSEHSPLGNKATLQWWWFNCSPRGGLFKDWRLIQGHLSNQPDTNVCNFQGFCPRMCCVVGSLCTEACKGCSLVSGSELDTVGS